MGVPDRVEACGRCAMSSVVDVAGEYGTGWNPFDGERIEVDEDQVRRVSPHLAALGRIRTRIDRWMVGQTYGRPR